MNVYPYTQSFQYVIKLLCTVFTQHKNFQLYQPTHSKSSFWQMIQTKYQLGRKINEKTRLDQFYRDQTDIDFKIDAT